jgi:hypothetical protein
MIAGNRARRGVAIMWALVIVTVLSLVSATAVWQISAGRRALERRQHLIQAVWLARSGAEIAAERLMVDADYAGESIEVIPDTGLRITVAKDPAATDVYRIRCEAQCPATGPGSIGRALAWKAIRRDNPRSVALELVTDDDAMAP